ncbi:MAG: peptidase E [Actinomycetota bacterium]|nr:peptidase E [Actinomycetota bacterium]
MTSSLPTIIATSGGFISGRRNPIAYGPLIHYALERSGVEGRSPSICHISTASGDQRYWQANLDLAAKDAGVICSHLNLFPMPNVDDIESFLGDHDVIWVGGGSVANLLAIWRLHGLDEIMPRLWRSGKVLGGVSAGSICWHVGGTTDSFGPDLRVVDNGLSLLPYSNGVHYNSEPQRRPLFQSAISKGLLPDGYATDDGVGLVYVGTALEMAVSEVVGRFAYGVRKTEDGVVEEVIEPTSLI